jgi:leader peptidase (prepilin peptidase) / N-methyltransferase
LIRTPEALRVNPVLAIPLGVRLVVLFVLGAIVAGCINLAVYRLAWNQRLISPWSAAPAGAPRRRWTDRIPIVGWPAMARESPWHGRGFWIRPMLVELATGLLFAGLYAWELQDRAAWLLGNGGQPAAPFLNANLALVSHWRFLSHAVLVSLMLVAALIDLDEKTIPDAITVPGTLVALALAAALPWSLLPAGVWLIAAVPQVEFLTLASPNAWPGGLAGLPENGGIALGLGCWTLWCGGLMPRRWNTRHGFGVAVRVFVHRLCVDVLTYQVLAMWAVGVAAIGLAAWALPLAHWAGLLTALVGVAVGGGIIWAVRTVGSAALLREAMGFGDVTLMSMIGAFVGWQAAIIVFFIAPFLGLVFGLAQWIFHGEHEVPYGPFLCLAALWVIVDWNSIWPQSQSIFALGWIVPTLLAGCVVLMGVMLVGYRLVLRQFGSRGR